MKLPEFLVSYFMDGEQRYTAIIQTKPPYLIAIPVFIGQEDAEAIEKWNNDAANGRCVKIQGYSIYVYPYDYPDLSQQDQVIVKALRSIADFFKEEVLVPKPGKYRRYNENPAPLPPVEFRKTMEARDKLYRLKARKLRHRIMTGQADDQIRLESQDDGDENEEGE